MTPLLCFETGDVSCVVLQRRPELGRGSQDILERAWHHADDSIEVVVERNLATQDRAVAAEATPPQSITIRPACGYGSDSNRMGFTVLKMAVLAPTPKARVSTLTIANPGFLRKLRSA